VFVFKKIVSQFFFPIPLALILLLLGLILLWRGKRERLGRLLTTVAMLALLFFSLPFFPKAVYTRLERDYVPCVTPAERLPDDIGTNTVYVVALGTGFNPNPDYPFTMRTSGVGWVRLLEAARIHRKLPGSRLILSIPGPADETDKQAFLEEVTRFLALERSRVQAITGARTTFEEARHVQEAVGAAFCVIVSDASHLRRAEKLFRDEGMSVAALPCSISYPHSTAPQFRWLDWFPSSWSACGSRGAMYEIMGLAWEWVRGRGRNDCLRGSTSAPTKLRRDKRSPAIDEPVASDSPGRQMQGGTQ